MSRPIPSTTNVYIPGVGITITRANIELEQQRRYESNQKPATSEEIVMTFCTPAERVSKDFPTSKRYKKLVERAGSILRNPKKSKK